MRIRRSVLFITQQITKSFLRKTTFTVLGAALIAGGVVIGQNILTTPRTSYAATPVDSCFGFNTATGAIDSYHDNEGNNPANPACPRSVDIPATIGGVAVTSIGTAAFQAKQITSLTIPSSVTSIGDAAFNTNLITSLTIPSSVTTIGYYAFSVNHLTSLTIPSSVTLLGNGAFAANDLTSLTIQEGLTVIRDGTFRDNKLTSLTIPASITDIRAGAFYDNSISALTIPDTVTSLGDFSFSANQLTSIHLGCGINTILNETFAINKLQEVTIPDCISTVEPAAFFGQNPWGGVVDVGTDPAHDWLSSDLATRMTVYDAIWYVRLYTSNPSNLNHLVDGISNESWYTGDINGDGDHIDSIGGHLVNPASVSVRYVDGSNASLSADYASTGHLADGTNLSDYLAKNVQVPPIADVPNPTPDEQAALEVALGQFSRLGQDVSLTAPTIPGYTLQHPSSPYAANLISKNNAINFTYAVTQTNTTSPNHDETTASPITNPSINSTSSRPTPQSTTTTNENNATPASVPNETRTKVDFTAPAGSATNPTAGAAPQGLAPIIARSSLAVDDTKPCHQIDSAKLLSATSFAVPDIKYKALGGLAFVLNCATVGGNAAVTFTLGDAISDITKIKVYKQNSHGDKTDITNQVSINNNDGSHTTLRYSLQDGKSLDDDGIANSSISDPIYITVPDDTVSAVKLSATNKTPWWTMPLVAGSIVTVLVITIAIAIINKRRKL